MYFNNGVILLKIAVIDDEEGILLSMRVFLEMEGHQPVTFSSPKKALAVLSQEKVDLIILDIRMPEMTGEELAMKFKKTALTKDIPIILFSAHDTLPEIALKVGAEGILEKPFHFDKLIHLLNNILA